MKANLDELIQDVLDRMDGTATAFEHVIKYATSIEAEKTCYNSDDWMSDPETGGWGTIDPA